MIDRKLPFVLTIEEKRSAFWRKLEDYCEDRLEVLRKENDADRSEIETARLRGRIAELKSLISLGKETAQKDHSLLNGSEGF